MINKDKFQGLLAEFKAEFLAGFWNDEKYKREAIKCFQDNWDINAPMQTGQFNTVTFHSHNMYQIFTYVKNYDLCKDGSVSGMLLYAKTDEPITPDNDFVMGGNKISVKTLDLNLQFSDIAAQLDDIVKGVFDL